MRAASNGAVLLAGLLFAAPTSAASLDDSFGADADALPAAVESDQPPFAIAANPFVSEYGFWIRCRPDCDPGAMPAASILGLGSGLEQAPWYGGAFPAWVPQSMRSRHSSSWLRFDFRLGSYWSGGLSYGPLLIEGDDLGDTSEGDQGSTPVIQSVVPAAPCEGEGCVQVPEPGTYALLLAGLVGLGVVAVRRREDVVV